MNETGSKSRASDEIPQTATTENKGPAPQPPLAGASSIQMRDSNVGQMNGNSTAVTKQPQRYFSQAEREERFLEILSKRTEIENMHVNIVTEAFLKSNICGRHDLLVHL